MGFWGWLAMIYIFAAEGLVLIGTPLNIGKSTTVSARGAAGEVAFTLSESLAVFAVWLSRGGPTSLKLTLLAVVAWGINSYWAASTIARVGSQPKLRTVRNALVSFCVTVVMLAAVGLLAFA